MASNAEGTNVGPSKGKDDTSKDTKRVLIDEDCVKCQAHYSEKSEEKDSVQQDPEGSRKTPHITTITIVHQVNGGVTVTATIVLAAVMFGLLLLTQPPNPPIQESSLASPLPASPDWKVYKGFDSPSNNIGSWNDPSNFGWSLDKCRKRCEGSPDCKGFGYNPKLRNGYCVLKHTIRRTLVPWDGDLYVR